MVPYNVVECVGRSVFERAEEQDAPAAGVREIDDPVGSRDGAIIRVSRQSICWEIDTDNQSRRAAVRNPPRHRTRTSTGGGEVEISRGCKSIVRRGAERKSEVGNLVDRGCRSDRKCGALNVGQSAAIP